MHSAVLPVLISFSKDYSKSARHFLFKSFNLFLLVWCYTPPPPSIFTNIVYSFIIVNDRKVIFQISIEGQWMFTSKWQELFALGENAVIKSLKGKLEQ